MNITMYKLPAIRRSGALALTTLLLGCAVGPKYEQPELAVPAQFKEQQGIWVPAVPAEALARGPWWELFGDQKLSELVSRVEVSNQNIAVAMAAYAQAQALVEQQQATILPSVELAPGASRSGGNGTSNTSTNYQLRLSASWQPDLWGRLGLAVNSATAAAEASAADLAAAKLSAQAALVAAYITLRQADVQHHILSKIIDGYKRALQIAQNRYDAGIVARIDVLQAQTQLASVQASDWTLRQQRAQAEHAMAVLIGQAPADFSVPAMAEWKLLVPEIPPSVPSALLQRRPDIAASERRVAQANAQIGIAQAAYYPNINLTGSSSTGGPHISDLFSVSNLVWALGASLAETVFDGGARSAQVDSARAGLNKAAANYRQTVLLAFKDVEDQLAVVKTLQEQQGLREQAFNAASQVEERQLNNYKAGLVSFTEVTVAQAAAFSAQQSLLQLQANRQTAAVALIQALGGDWQGLQP